MPKNYYCYIFMDLCCMNSAAPDPKTGGKQTGPNLRVMEHIIIFKFNKKKPIILIDKFRRLFPQIMGLENIL